MTALPPDIGPEDEITVNWNRDQDGFRIDAILGDASISVASSYEAAETIPWLIAALPNVLEAAWAAIEDSIEEEA